MMAVKKKTDLGAALIVLAKRDVVRDDRYGGN